MIVKMTVKFMQAGSTLSDGTYLHDCLPVCTLLLLKQSL
uniref:Uncharacterized protein n=1 Tax=Anguilla anguilla TaxID=7936 RepID=A0A0E9SW62_ANGAN